MYEYALQIGISHIGRDSLLKPGAAVDILQNADWFQLDTETAFMDYLRANHAGLYLVSRQIEILRLPAYGEFVTVKSWVHTCDTRFGYRNTAIYDASGVLCIGTYGVGIFVDLEKAAPAKVKEESLKTVTLDPALDMEVLPRKINLPDKMEQMPDTTRVQPCHLDNYGHMNNARYVDIASAWIPDGFTLRRMRAEYKKAALPGDLIIPWYCRPNDRTIVIALRAGDGTVFTAMEFTAAS